MRCPPLLALLDQIYTRSFEREKERGKNELDNNVCKHSMSQIRIYKCIRQKSCFLRFSTYQQHTKTYNPHKHHHTTLTLLYYSIKDTGQNHPRNSKQQSRIIDLQFPQLKNNKFQIYKSKGFKLTFYQGDERNLHTFLSQIFSSFLVILSLVNNFLLILQELILLEKKMKK